MASCSVTGLPKDKLIYGPLQIESRIDQDPAISGQLTSGISKVPTCLRGNLLVIPVGQSFLYVEPLYLQAQSNPLPELKRVVVANGNRIAMAESLDLALNQVFANAPASPSGMVSTLPPPTSQPSAAASSSAPVIKCCSGRVQRWRDPVPTCSRYRTSLPKSPARPATPTTTTFRPKRH